ncbi:MAG TPA: hypothetical protein VIQ05_03100 [Tardiphaga sp.]
MRASGNAAIDPGCLADLADDAAASPRTATAETSATDRSITLRTRASDVDLDEASDSNRQCPQCHAVLKLARVSPGPSPDYEAHTFVCMGCDFVFTARVE